MYYDVVVNNNLNKCEQLYNALLMVDCKLMTNGVVYLREAVKKREPKYIRYAYRIFMENGVWFYYGYKNREKVGNNAISLTDFIQMIRPERTVTL